MHPSNKGNPPMKVYICFDRYNDLYYFQMMRAWKLEHKVDFKFFPPQDLNRKHAEKPEAEIKSQIRKQIQTVDAFVVLIGESTRYLSQFVQWEMEVALAEDKPIIAVNLNGLRFQDVERCPSILQDELVVHISFHAVILHEALLTWPKFHTSFQQQGKSGPHYYDQSYYSRLGL